MVSSTPGNKREYSNPFPVVFSAGRNRKVRIPAELVLSLLQPSSLDYDDGRERGPGNKKPLLWIVCTCDIIIIRGRGGYLHGGIKRRPAGGQKDVWMWRGWRLYINSTYPGHPSSRKTSPTDVLDRKLLIRWVGSLLFRVWLSPEIRQGFSFWRFFENLKTSHLNVCKTNLLLFYKTEIMFLCWKVIGAMKSFYYTCIYT